MNRYRVRVKLIEVYEAIVSAPSSWEANTQTDTMGPHQMVKIRDERDSTTLEEYGPITVVAHRMGPVVFTPPFGTVFTQADIDDILKLVAEHVAPVEDHWNGIGCTTFSVRSKGTPTEDQEDAVREALIRRFERSADKTEMAKELKAGLEEITAPKEDEG